METENKIKSREVVRIQYFLYCPECNQEIKGNSSDQVNYALNSHLKSKHRKESMENEIRENE